MKKALYGIRPGDKRIALSFFNTSNPGAKTIHYLCYICLLLVLVVSSQRSNAQTCVATDYNLLANKQTITLSTTASTSGNINVLKDGNISNNSFYYTGASQAVAGKEYVRMQFPGATVLKGFEIAVGAYLFSNGAVMQVDGSNDGVNWTTLHTETETASVSGCIYGTCATAESYSFPTNTTAYTYYRLYGVSGTSRATPWINELFFDLAPIEQSGIGNLACSTNGTLFNELDDQITFDLNPTGGTGSYTVSVAGTTVTPNTGTFGVPASFTLGNGTAGGGDLTMTITGFTSGCTLTETITDPGNCLPGECGGPNWNLPALKSTISASVTVSNSPSPSDPNRVLDSDAGTSHTYKSNTVVNLDIMKFTFPEPAKLYGIELQTTQAIFNNNSTMVIQASNDDVNYVDLTGTITYPTNLSLVTSLYGGTQTVYRFEFPSNDTEYLYYRLRGISGGTIFGHGISEAYFSSDVFDAGLTNISCNHNGTLFDAADDYITFDLNPIGGTGSYTVSVAGTTITPTTGTYGVSTTFTLGAGTAGGGDLGLTITDFTLACQNVETIIDPGNCLPGECGGTDWNLAAEKSTISASVTVSNSPSPSNPNNVLDSNPATSHFYKNNTIVNLDIMKFTFPEPAKLYGIELQTTQAIFDNNSTMVIQASNDDVNYVDLTGTITYPANLSLVASLYGGTQTVYRFEFPTNDTEYLYYRLRGISGGTEFNHGISEAYFLSDVFDAGLSNVSVDDNGTAANLGDDIITFDLTPAPGSGVYSVSVGTGYTIAPTTANFGETTTFTVSTVSSSVGDLVVQVIDASIPCVQDVLVRQLVDVAVAAEQAACASPTDNPLASIVITGTDGEITKAGYFQGTSYFGPDYASATAVSNLSGGFTLVNNLPNPTLVSYYTVRAYLDEFSFRDYVLTVNKKVCSTADLSLAVSPATDSANEGENLIYTVSLTNNGPDPAVNVAVKVDLPGGLHLITVSPTLGTYSPGTQLWTIDQMPLGVQTLTITYRMQ